MADQAQTKRPDAPAPQESPSPPVTPSPSPQAQPTLSGEPLRDAEGRGSTTADATPAEAVHAAAAGQRVTPELESKAMQWFLSDEQQAEEVETKELKLNFGSEDDPIWVPWTIRPVGIDTMRAIRKRATESRQARRTGAVDEYRTNLEVVVAGTQDPNLAAAAQEMRKAGKLPDADAANALRVRFQNKPGYIAQVAGEIMSLSGFDDDDVQDAEATTAAGNS